MRGGTLLWIPIAAVSYFIYEVVTDPGTQILVGIMAGVLIIGAISIYLDLPKCTRCNSRLSLSRRHVTKNGQPDKRFSYNPLECSKCGNVQD